MKRLFLNVAFRLFAVLVLVGCDVHQWPELRDEPDPVPTPDVPRATIALRLEYETDLYLWEHLYDPVLARAEEVNPTLDLFPGYPGTSYRYSNLITNGQVQVFVKVFPTSTPSLCVAEKTFISDINGPYDDDIEMEVPSEGTYNIIVWSQFAESAESAPYYDPSSFSRVHIIDENYNGNTDYRDGFRGQLLVDMTVDANSKHVIRMKRPMGKFELVTTDLSEFLDRETDVRRLPTRASVSDYRSVITFSMYYPSSYSAIDDRLENASVGVGFETTMTVTGESEASLGFEYVLLNDIPDGGVQARVDVYRLDGTRVAGSATFTIPMRRNHHTLLRGAFLSMEGGGGVGIDPGFNGDHNITWN